MKNLRKISKSELKEINGGNAPCCEPWGTCPAGYKQCRAWGACLRIETVCNP